MRLAAEETVRERERARAEDYWKDGDLRKVPEKPATQCIHEPVQPRSGPWPSRKFASGWSKEAWLGSSAWTPKHAPSGAGPTGTCLACSDEQDAQDLARVDCKHRYCKICLATLFELAMKDESMYPPK
jgi:hypothetical protein